MMSDLFQDEPCMIERKSKCAQCLSLAESIFPQIPFMLQQNPVHISEKECAAIKDLWMKANDADKMEADWSKMKTDLRELWNNVMTSWIFTDYDIHRYSFENNDDVRSLMNELSDEAKRIRRMFGFCAEIARLSRLRIRLIHMKPLDLKDLLTHIFRSEYENRVTDLHFETPLPTIYTDEGKWILIFIDMARGIFDNGSEIHVSSGGKNLILQAKRTGISTEKMRLTAPRRINIYKANRMLSWYRCEMKIEEGEDVKVTIIFNDSILGIDSGGVLVPMRCIGCVSRVDSLYGLYTSIVTNDVDSKMPKDCPIDPIIRSTAKLKRILMKEWDNIANNVERAARDACEPINSIIRMTGYVINEPNDKDLTEHPLLTDIANKIGDSKAFMLMLRELNEIAFVDGNMFEEATLFETIPVSKLIADAIEVNQDIVFQSGAEIRTLSEFPMTLVRKKRWVRIFSELIENSILYNESNPPRIDIWSDGTKVFIKDNGIGISKEKWTVIFDIFTSLTSGKYSKKNRGEHPSGIGLFIAKRYAQWDEGNIRVMASDENGTTFEIALPHSDDIA